MKKLYFFFAFFIFSWQSLVSQCPVFTNSTLSSPDCFFGNTSCDLCVGNELTLEAEGSGLPDGECVNWYYDPNPGFDPYAGEGTLIDCGMITTDDPCSVCLTIEAIKVNPQGNDNENEYIIFNSGGGLNLDDLEVDFNITNNGSSPDDDDISPFANCQLQTPSFAMNGCPSAVAIGPGDNIPPNALVVVFTGAAASAANTDDFSNLCATGAPIYYTQSTCYRLLGAFTNNPSSVTNQSISNSACGCNSSMQIFPGEGGTSGDHKLRNGTTGNSGTSSPPVTWTPGNPLNSFVDPVTFTITDDMCNGGPYYIKGRIEDIDPSCPQVLTTTFEFDVICPVADITGDDEVCLGSSADLTATGGGTYMWDNGNPNDMISVTPSSPTDYYVTVTIGNCEDEASFFVDVLPLESVFLGDDEICEDFGLYDLNNLVDLNYPDGVWSGQGVAGDLFDPSGLGGQVVSLDFDPDDPCADFASTTITVNLYDIPVLLEDTVCQSSGIFDLTTIGDPFYTNGIWSGQGVSGTDFDPSGLSGIIDITFESDDDCIDLATTEILVLLGSQPDLRSDTICENSGIYDLNQIEDPGFPDGTWRGMGVVGDTFDPTGQRDSVLLIFEPTGGCSAEDSTFIVVNPSGKPNLTNDTICQSGGAYDLTQLQDPSFPAGTWFGQGVIGSQLFISGLEGAVTVRFVPTDACFEPDTTTVVIYEPITYDSLLLTCDSLNSSYLVSFEITGGDSANIFVTSGGTLSGNLFLSDSLMPGDSFRFEIWDGGACPAVLVEGAHACGCSSYAGEMVPVPDTLIFCESETAAALSDSTFYLDGNDTLVYVLHTSDSASLGTIVGTNNLPEFIYDASSMSFGTTYFISTVVSSKDSMNNIDLADTCLSIAPGIPIQFTNNPQAFFVDDITICRGDTGTLQLALNGIAGFYYEVYENNILFSAGNTQFGVVDLQVFPTANSVYSINAFSDSNCPGVILDTFANVTVLPPLNLTFLDTVFYGNGTFSVILDIQGGDSLSYSFSGASGSWDGDVWTSDPLPCDTLVNVCVSGGVCNEVCYSGTFSCASPCSTFAGTMLSDTLHLCQNERARFSNLNPIRDSDDILRYYLHTLPGNNLGTVLGIYDTDEFDYFPGLSLETVYYFSAVVGNDNGSGSVDLNDNCTSIAPGTPVIFHNYPDAVFGNDMTVCAGEDVQIDLNLFGNAPFDFSYEINNVAYPPVNSAGMSIAVSNVFSQSGQVVLTQINDRYCNAVFTDTLNVNLYPDLQVQNLNIDCDSITQTYVVSFDIAGGDPSSYQVIAGVGTLTGNRFEGFSVPSGDSYNYLVFDGNHCDTIVVFDRVNCSCSTNAGTLEPFTSVPTICGNDEVLVLHQGDTVLDNDDLLKYVLHDSPGPGLGNILAISNFGRFTYNTGMVYGQTYYISAIAGSRFAADSIDMNDGCLSTSVGNPVIFQPAPSANFSLGTEICEGDSTVLNFTFNGIPDYRIFYDIIINGVRMPDSLTSTTNSILENYSPPPGINQVTFEMNRVESQGCISPVSGSQTLNVNLSQINRIERSLCIGDSLEVNGQVYNESNPSDTIVFSRQAQNGCDSLIYISLTFGNSAMSVIDTTLCEGDFIEVNNRRYDASNPIGTETITRPGFCDSVIDVRLDFYQPISFDLRDTLCLTDTLIVNGTIYDQFNPSGIETLVAANQCDSTVRVDLFFQNSLTGTYRDTLCQGDFFELGGERFDQITPSGQVTLASAAGCDSLVNVELEFRQSVEVSLTGRASICAGDSATILINLTGATIADIEIRTGRGEVFNLSNIPDGYEWKVSPAQSSTYQIADVSGSLIHCPASITGGLVIIEVSDLEVAAQISDYQGYNISCFDENDGSIDVSISGGMQPVSIIWRDGSTDSVRNTLSAGTYFYQVSDNAGCIDSLEIELTEPEALISEVFVTDPSCQGEEKGNILINSIVGGTSPYELLIDNNSQGTISSFPVELLDLDSGAYSVSIMDANGCEVSENYQISAAGNISVSLGADTTISLGATIQLSGATSITPANIIWTPSESLSCDTCLSTLAAPSETVTYQITIFDAEGCSASDNIRVAVLNQINVFIPEAFSPNDDGINDVFSIFSDAKGLRINKFYVFDRWGNALYEGIDLPLNDPLVGWDGDYKGKRMDTGVYVFFAEIEFLDGTTEIFKGDITLLH